LTLDLAPSIVAGMGKHDNRRSMKMRRRTRQRKKKLRQRKRVAARVPAKPAAEASGGKRKAKES
jgi:hypothetical protein